VTRSAHSLTQKGWNFTQIDARRAHTPPEKRALWARVAPFFSFNKADAIDAAYSILIIINTQFGLGGTKALKSFYKIPGNLKLNSSEIVWCLVI
jgi:hypothetical protein